MYTNSKIKLHQEKERLENIRNESVAYCQAKLVQSNQPSRIKALINHVIRSVNKASVKPATPRNAQVKLHSEDAL